MVGQTFIFCVKCMSGEIDRGFTDGGFIGLKCCSCNAPIQSLKDIVIGTADAHQGQVDLAKGEARKTLESCKGDFKV